MGERERERRLGGREKGEKGRARARARAEGVGNEGRKVGREGRGCRREDEWRCAKLEAEGGEEWTEVASAELDS